MTKKRIVVLGGGFAGVYAAKSLRKRLGTTAVVELINDVNYFVFQPLLPELAGGSIAGADAVSPLRALLKGVHVRKAEVLEIDPAARSIGLVQGTKRRFITIDYDELVIALGQRVDLSRIPGMTEHAFKMKNVADAFRLRNHVINCLEHADVTQDLELKAQLLTFVVVGGGFSGVETVGEIKDLIDRTLRYYPNIDKEEVRVIVVEYADRILQELPPELASYAQKQLERRGIEFILSTGTSSATGTSLQTSDGKIIATKTVVATIGNGPHQLVENLEVPKVKGKILVDRTLRVRELENVWSVGDAALIPLVDEPSGPNDYAPPTAQFAVREGDCVARNIARAIGGGEPVPFSYKSKGAMASLGGRRAVANVYGIRLSGVVAWFLWRAFYLSFLPGLSSQIRVLFNWLLDTVLPRSIVQVHQSEYPPTQYVHFRKGDCVFENGMLADGFYVVISGSFELAIEKGESVDRTVKRLVAGDHFGERVIFGDGLRTGSVKALEDSMAFVVNREDFSNFANAFPVLRNYFENYIPQAFPHAVKSEK